MTRVGLGIASALVVALLFVLARSFGRDPHEVPFGLEKKPAPNFRLRPLDGGTELQLQALRGKPVVINFWASWCNPCAAEHAVLEWGAERFGTSTHFLGIVFEDTRENALGFLREYGTRFTQLEDPRSKTAVDFGVAGVPETYFVDADGIIRSKHVGPIPVDTLVKRVEELQASAGASSR
ncbi:MAG: redoxin domain-containing protein [Myxococcaceae bacterium]